MNVFQLAAELIGDIELSPGQLAQLRALDRKYAQRVYTILHGGDSGTPHEPTEAETAELRAQLTADILDLLTPEQRSRKG
jgi:hypothetical protein